MKQLWQRILNVFHPEIATPIEEWQKEIFEELDTLSPLDEKYWRVVELLSDKGEAELYFLRKKYPQTPRKVQERQVFRSSQPIVSDSYKRPLHQNPHHKKQPW